MHVFIIMLANYLVQYTFQLSVFIIPYGLLVYPFILLLTDLTVRINGKEKAYQVISIAFIPASILTMYWVNVRIGLASGLAYFIAQGADIFIFSKIRKRLNWYWGPLIAGFFATIIDTATFFSIAFGLSYSMLQEIGSIIFFKLLFDLLIVIPLYGFFLKRQRLI